MKEQREIIQEIQLIHQSVSWQDSLLQSYRMLFIGIETILFAVAGFMIGYHNRGAEISEFTRWGLAGSGWFTFLAWMVICNQRGRIIDRQKEIIKRLIKKAEPSEKGDLTEWFKPYTEEWREKHPPRLFFNILLPIGVAIMWGFMAFCWLK